MGAIAPNLKYEAMGQTVNGGKDIIDVGYRECRFPIGEREGTTMFCAAGTSTGVNYCPDHLDRMYQPRKGNPVGNRPFILPK